MHNNYDKREAIDYGKGSPTRFGYEWNRYSEIEPVYEEQFRRWTVHLTQEDWKNKYFLDVGCGMGRNSYWPMKYGASGGVAIDVDDRSLKSARKTLENYPSVHLKHKSAYDLDETNCFDIAFSIGVIHHLEYPEKALKAMVNSVVPGGKVLIWVYGYENNEWIVQYLNPLRKLLFSKLPISLVHFLSLFPASILWLFLKLGIGRIEYFKLIKDFSFWHIRSIVFDQMLPNIANYWAKDEVEDLMRKAGLNEVKLSWVNEMSWSAIGVKPE